MNSFGQGSATVNKYINMMAKAKVTQSDLSGLGLPKIAGTWYFVDYASGNDNYNGMTVDKPFKLLSKAYTACTTGRGDGICILSRTISGTSYSTNIGDGRLTWAKYGITVYGVASPQGYFGRARVANTTDGDSTAALINITGQNNTFYNINFYHAPNTTTHTGLRTTQISAIQISGARNTFINCHFNCSPDVNTYAAYLSTGITLRAGSDENVFEGCYFGSSSFDVGNTASCWIHMATGSMAGQRFFRGCTFLQQCGPGTAFGGIESGASTSLNGVDIYETCNFAVWRASTSPAGMLTSFFIGTNPGSGYILMRDCILAGFNLLDSVAGNDKIFTNQPAGNSAGGIAITP